jgi:hypothetical protein
MVPSLCKVFTFYDVLTIHDLMPYLRYGTWNPLPRGIVFHHHPSSSHFSKHDTGLLRPVPMDFVSFMLHGSCTASGNLRRQLDLGSLCLDV